MIPEVNLLEHMDDTQQTTLSSPLSCFVLCCSGLGLSSEWQQMDVRTLRFMQMHGNSELTESMKNSQA